MTTLAMLACAVSDTEARFAVEATVGPVRVVLTMTEPVDGEALADPVYSPPVALDADGCATLAVAGLTPGARYWWRVEDDGVVDDTMTGTFLPAPPAGVPASYTFEASGDAGLGSDGGFTGTELLPHRISNHEIHAFLAHRMLDEGWIARLCLGDMIYYDYGRPGYAGSTTGDYHRGWRDLWLQPNQVAWFLSGSWVHIQDDHDGGPNDWAGETFPDKINFATVFRQREPHHDLPDTGATYRTWTWGRVQYVMWDCRYYRSDQSTPDGPGKTMLGADQKQWFADILASSTAEAIVVISSVQWMSGGSDSWPGYAHERQEIADLIANTGWAHRLVMLSADAHKLAIDTGGGNRWGGWPCAVFAARDATPSAVSGHYDVLEQGGIGQYGTVTVTDMGSVITIKLTAWQNGTEVGAYTKAFITSTPTIARDIGELVSGSHQALYEARVVTDYQTGPDPDGVEIGIEAGEIVYDATARVWSSMQMETPGIDEYDGSSRFPRFPDSLLAPYGNEVYIRAGIRTGPDVLWVPLGYYRIDDTDQQRTSNGKIRIAGQDRWAGLEDARLLIPRQYRAEQTRSAVVSGLVREVYPDAVIAWDDDSDQLPLGRDLIVERDRAGALTDIAESIGKVTYFDSEGILRFEDVPDPDRIVWDIRAGVNGVLVDSARRVNRDGAYNAVVATGEGSTGAAVQGIAVDVGEHSPTRWGGRFGQKPRFYSSPLLTTGVAAQKAARTILLDHLGVPYSATFGTVPNPALRPRLAVRIEQLDGNREKHVVQSLRMPLVAGALMTGSTREQTLAQVGTILPAAGVAQIDTEA